MKYEFEKRTLADMNRCYAVTTMDFDGKPYALYATEGEGSCIAYDCTDFEDKKIIWEGPGGTMSIAPIPARANEFLAVQKFFRLFDWEEAEIVWTKMEPDGSFTTKTLLRLPYIHRFDILKSNGLNYLVACTLASHKETREDWSLPGSLYVAKLPENLDEPIQLQTLREDLFKNHGFQRTEIDGHDAALITCENGVFLVTPPQKSGDEWNMEQIMNLPTSDAALIDIDGDGELEIAAIQKFHGSFYRIYKKIDGQYQMIFEHPEVSEFYHVVNSGTLAGRPVFIGGCRRGRQQLFIVSWNEGNKSFDVTTVDESTGPSNACIYNMPDKDLLICANREIGQAAVYTLKNTYK